MARLSLSVLLVALAACEVGTGRAPDGGSDSPDAVTLGGADARAPDDAGPLPEPADARAPEPDAGTSDAHSAADAASTVPADTGTGMDSGTAVPADAGATCAPGCTQDSECNDSLACTADSCVEGFCVNTPSCAANGACCAACARSVDPDCAPPTWNTAAVIASDCSGDVVRPMATGVYDLYANATFVTFMGPDVGSRVAAMDHRAGTWSAPVLALPHPIGLGSISWKYSYPQLEQTPDGHLHVVFADHDDDLYYARSKVPHRIDGGWTTTQLANLPLEAGLKVYEQPASGTVYLNYARTSYPTLSVSRDGAIYVFFRHAITDPERPFFYAKSVDGGLTWLPARPLARTWLVDPSITSTLREVYLGQVTPEPVREGVPERWHMVWIAAGGPTHNDFHKNIYYAVFTPQDDHLWGADGADLGEMVDQAEMDAHCLVVDSGPAATKPMAVGYTQIVAANEDGVPLVNGTRVFRNGAWQDSPAGSLTTTDGLLLESRRGRFVGYASTIIQESYDGGDHWLRTGTAGMPNKKPSIAVSRIPVTRDSQPAARLWLKEQELQAGTPATPVTNNKVAVAGHTSSQVARKLLIRTGALARRSASIPLRAFVVDEENARVGTTTRVRFKVTGPATLVGPEVICATDGMAEVTLQLGASPGHVEVVATASGVERGVYSFALR